MKLIEMKKKVLRLIEEVSSNSSKLTDDPDIESKLNDVINQIQFELARIKRIPAQKAVKISKEKTTYDLRELPDFYQLEAIKFLPEGGEEGDIDIFGTIVDFYKEGTAKLYYYKYPERIEDNTNDDAYIFELADDVLEIMPYGVAADILKSDVSNSYGNIYAQRYESMMQRIDPRYQTGFIYIEGAEI